MPSLLAVLAVLPIGLNRTPLWAAYFALVMLLFAYVVALRPTTLAHALRASKAVWVPLVVALLWLVYQLVYLLPLGADLVCRFGDPRCAGGFLSGVDLMVPTALTLSPWETQNHLMLFFGHLVLFALVFALSGRRRLRAKFYLWLMLLAIGEAVIAWIQVALAPVGEKMLGVTGSLLNPNHFGSLMLFLFALSAVIPSIPRGLREAPGWMNGTAEFMSRHHVMIRVFILSAALLSFSRGVWVAGLFVGLLWVLYRVSGKRFVWPLVGLLVTAVAGGLGLAWALAEHAGALFATDRFLLWASVYDAAMQAPLFGYGPGSFEHLYPYFKPLTLPPLIYDHAHSDYLEVLFEQGWAGLGLLVATIAGALVVGARLAGRARGSARVALHSLLFGAAVPLTHGLIDFPLSIPGITALVVVVAAVAVRGALESRRD